ncbi:hypothetical protein ORV05_16400 [Amycolatopsis cynarae]|uniref:Uncharacterized protein n=1 Tax=Amycolatopsis cynarae TaxID=2995223 RepID=A0ABY7BCX9_9PSEU|nr:hypothetical protein [Amycolatopsis sp. HUAS 11-8]WAL69279.1 hypothetical protein ORV05_16400 [Amycolatopsis sp. HUAS 11-8]
MASATERRPCCEEFPARAAGAGFTLDEAQTAAAARLAALAADLAGRSPQGDAGTVPVGTGGPG